MIEPAREKRGRGRPRNELEDRAAAAVLRRMGESGCLERGASEPLWVQLRNLIEDAIREGELGPLARLPSEQTICDFFNVSRPVVRGAISSLASDGLVTKMPRRGMFIAPPRQETEFLTANLSVYSDLSARGHEVTSKTFEFVRTLPDEEEQRVFRLPDGGRVVRIGRVYYMDGNPLTYTHISLPGHKVPDIEEIALDGRSIFGTLRERYGLVAVRAERWLSAAMPHPAAAAMMGVPEDEPMIWIESVAYDPDGGPLEFYRAYYNSAVARVHVSTSR